MNQEASRFLPAMGMMDAMFQKKKFKEALPLARKLLREFPKEPMAHVTVAICHVELDKPELGVDILRKAGFQFPHDHNIFFNLGLIQEGLELYDEAIQSLRRALELIPGEQKNERANCYNSIASCLWELHRREEALEMWRQALKEDPGFKLAEENLRNCSNEYGGPKGIHNVFDDLYHFQKIQSEKFFEKKKQ